MVTKNKQLKKKEKYAQGQLVEAQCQISELEEQLRAQQMENRQLATTIPQDEVRHLETSLAKAQKAAEIAETEVGRFCNELRQSSDWETNVCAQARKALKDAQEKLQEQVTAHKRTMEALTKHVNTEAHAEEKILELQEDAKKQQQWFEEHLASSANLAK